MQQLRTQLRRFYEDNAPWARRGRDVLLAFDIGVLLFVLEVRRRARSGADEGQSDEDVPAAPSASRQGTTDPTASGPVPRSRR